jgi:hypothetical protein
MYGINDREKQEVLVEKYPVQIPDITHDAPR